MIGEEFDKKWRAMMKYTKNDRSKTTRIMDGLTEDALLFMYFCWVLDQEHKPSDQETFYKCLKQNLAMDANELRSESRYRDWASVTLKKNIDGNYDVSDWSSLPPRERNLRRERWTTKKSWENSPGT